MRKRTIITLRDKFVLYFIIAGVSILLVTGLISYYTLRDAILARTYNQLISLRLEKQKLLEQFFMGQESLLKEVYQANKRENTERLVNKREHAFGKIWKLKMSDTYGYQLIYTKDTNATDGISVEMATRIAGLFSGSEIGKEIMYLDEPENSAGEVFPIYLCYKPPTSMDEAIVAGITEEDLSMIMYEVDPDNGLGKTGEAYLVGNDFYMKTYSRFQPHSIHNIVAKTEGVLSALQGKVGSGIIKDYRGVPVLSSFAPLNVGNLRWAILSEMDVEEVMSPVSILRKNLLLIGTITAALIFIIAIVVSSGIIKPIKKLGQAFEAVSSGNLDIVVESYSNDEIGHLVHSFNAMASQLKVKSQELEAERMRNIRLFLEGQEDERKRIAREIHDSLGQLLVVLNMRYERLCKAEAAESEQKRVISELIQETIAEARRISNDLASTALHELGLIEAIRSLLQRMHEVSGIQFQLFHDQETNKIDPLQSVYIYRIVQESLCNIVKHSQAKNANVNLRLENGVAILSTSDDGKGFIHAPAMQGNGIKNMQERARIIGGKLEISSEPNKGTIIKAFIPIT